MPAAQRGHHSLKLVNGMYLTDEQSSLLYSESPTSIQDEVDCRRISLSFRYLTCCNAKTLYGTILGVNAGKRPKGGARNIFCESGK